MAAKQNDDKQIQGVRRALWGVVIGKGLPEERTPELTSNDCVGATGKRLGENGLDVEGTTV